jgi:hypothetical protein
MAIHLSVGVATLVALMAADRAEADADRTMRRLLDRTAGRFAADLEPDAPQTVESERALR